MTTSTPVMQTVPGRATITDCVHRRGFYCGGHHLQKRLYARGADWLAGR